MDTHFIPLYRSDSVDSNATADNLPGPGRNLGLLYESLGRKLENRIHSFSARRQTALRLKADAIDILPCAESTDSVDTNATADNLPGPGRNLGRLYVLLGNKFTNALGRFLARHGHGPNAAVEVITRIRQHAKRDIRDMYTAYAMQGGSVPTEAEQMQLEKTCKKLVRYSR